MSQTKQISTLTDIEVRHSGTTIKIRTFYRELEQPFIIYGFISEEDFKLNYIPFSQGELGARMIYDPERIDCEVNSEGEFIVIGENADFYSINSFGELIYNDGVGSIIVYDSGIDDILLVSEEITDGGADTILALELEVFDGGEDSVL